MVVLNYLDFLLLAPLLGLVSAKPLAAGRRAMKVHDARSRPGAGFTAVAPAHPEQMLDLRINLVSNDMPGLEAKLLAMSTPGSSTYGQHMCKEDVAKYAAPCAEATASVKAWLASHGLNYTNASYAGDWIKLSVPVKHANAMFAANFTTFAHESGDTAVRTLQYSLPIEIAPHVALVHPTTTFMMPGKRGARLVANGRRHRGGSAGGRGAFSGGLPNNGSFSIGNTTVVFNGTDVVINGTDYKLPGGGAPTGAPLPPSSTDSQGPAPTDDPTGPAEPTTTDSASVTDSSTTDSASATDSSTTDSASATDSSTTDSASATDPSTTGSATTTGSGTSTDSSAPPAQSSAPAQSSTPGQTDASCAQEVTPACVQQLYGIPTQATAQANNTLAVSGFIGQFPQTADLAAFLLQFRPDIPQNTTFALQTLQGGQDPQSAQQAGIEANLDTQYSIGIAQGVPVTFISVGSQTTSGDSFLDIVNDLLGQDAVPPVLSTSYGEDEDNVGQQAATAFCNAYMMLGARGVSVIYSSGDSGVGPGNPNQQCTTFSPTFPSGCPYITSVGATDGVAPERGASFSSGGFSNLFTTPSYQSSAVSGYLSTLGSTNSGLFTATGRAFPDVSAQGTNIAIVSGGQLQPVEGTSASAPIFASVVALLNGERAAKGQAPLGFLNPWLYGAAASAGGLFDVTEGNNPGCGSQGFPAAAGWDPVTGLGTPNYAALRTSAGL